MSSYTNPKLTIYTMEGCGYCKEQKKEADKYPNKEFINCTKNGDNEVCQKLNAFPTLSMEKNLYQGLHTYQEILQMKNKK